MNNSNNIKPNFRSIGKENPFSKPPNDYFDNFNVRMACLISQEQKLAPHKSLWLKSKPQITTAIIFTCLSILIYIGVNYQFSKSNKFTSDEIKEAYKYGALRDLDESQLIQQVARIESEKQLEQDSLKKRKDQNRKEIIDYLTKENIDINNIIDAL